MRAVLAMARFFTSARITRPDELFNADPNTPGVGLPTTAGLAHSAATAPTGHWQHQHRRTLHRSPAGD